VSAGVFNYSFFQIRIKGGERERERGIFHLPRREEISSNKSTVQKKPTPMLLCTCVKNPLFLFYAVMGVLMMKSKKSKEEL
jgi:hypothetical protein